MDVGLLPLSGAVLGLFGFVVGMVISNFKEIKNELRALGIALYCACIGCLSAVIPIWISEAVVDESKHFQQLQWDALFLSLFLLGFLFLAGAIFLWKFLAHIWNYVF